MKSSSPEVKNPDRLKPTKRQKSRMASVPTPPEPNPKKRDNIESIPGSSQDFEQNQQRQPHGLDGGDRVTIDSKGSPALGFPAKSDLLARRGELTQPERRAAGGIF